MKVFEMLEQTPAKLIPYSAVKAIPVMTKTAPAIKIIYPLYIIYKRFIMKVIINKLYML